MAVAKLTEKPQGSTATADTSFVVTQQETSGGVTKETVVRLKPAEVANALKAAGNFINEEELSEVESKSDLLANANDVMIKKDLISRMKFGNYVTSGSEKSGFTLVGSQQTLSMSEIKYADRGFVVHMKPETAENIALAVALFGSKSDGKYYGYRVVSGWFSYSLRSISVPAGVYYWIGFRNNQNPTTLTREDIDNGFEIFETANGIGFGASNAGDIGYTPNSDGVNIEIRYTDKILHVDAAEWGRTKVTYEVYENANPGSVPVSIRHSLAAPFDIPADTYYRLVVFQLDDDTPVIRTYDEIVELYNSLVITDDTKTDFDRLRDAPDSMYKRDLISRLSFNNVVTSGNDEAGYTLVGSAQTLGLSKFQYAEKNVIVFAKPAALNQVGVGVEIFEYVDSKYTNMVSYTWFAPDTLKSFTIPAGAYYWIGFRNGTNPTTLKKDDLYQYYEVFETTSNIGVSGSNVKGYFSVSNNKAAVDIPIRYAPELTYVDSDDWSHTRVTAVIYPSNAVNAVPSSITYGKKQKFTIPGDSYFRLVVYTVDDSGNQISYGSFDEVIALYDKIKVYNVDEALKSQYGDFGALGLIANLATRIQTLEEANGVNTVPGYYESHIANKVAEINELKPEKGGQFIFITDIHVGGYSSRGGNQMHSHALINRIVNNTTIDKVFNGGDLLNNDASYSVPRSINRICKAISYAQPDRNCKQFFVVGNHDGGLDYGSGGVVTSPRHITADELAVASNVYSVAPYVRYDDYSPFQLYYDDPVEEIRYIVLDIGERDAATDETYTDSLKFYLNALVTTPEGYHVVVFNHRIINSELEVQEAYKQYLLDPMDALKAKTTYTLGSVTMDFSDASGIPACIICGHSHLDAEGVSEGGVPWFVTTSDNGGANIDESVTRTVGTITEQAFDVFTIDTENRAIYITRVGAGADRTAGY